MAKNLPAADWSMSLTEPGKIVEGLDDIAQCIVIITTTEKGSDPLRPTFGCNILRYLDKPVTVAGPSIVKEIIEGVRAWEKRAKITFITYQIEESNIIFSINWELVGDPKKIKKTEVQYARAT